MSSREFIHHFPSGFRPRRGLNWGSLGLMYASYYMCRYNLGWAVPGMKEEFAISTTQIGLIFGLSAWAYGFGQLFNGLFTDRIGGKRAMLTGAIATILVNILFGFASLAGTFTTLTLIWALNGYVQAFGAPGMIKINAAWFRKTERGTFAGIFGIMIQLGLFAINALAPLLLAGFSIFIWTVPALHWRWLFWVPTGFVALAALCLLVFVKETPEAAGYPGVVHEGGGDDEPDDDIGTDVTVSLRESFGVIIRHPLIWFYAVAYACTGAVRHGLGDFAVLYFFEDRGLDPTARTVVAVMAVLPFMAVVGSIGAGWVSDKFYRGARGPVGAFLYFLEALVITLAAVLIQLGFNSLVLSCVYMAFISLTANSTHSIIGAAAPMDIGGRKMAGFAAGVIDSFQYFGKGLALPAMGWMIDNVGWHSWFPMMAGCGFIGGVSMILMMRKQKKILAAAG